jgi:monoterpene epsilon-lactone hydrolase
MSLRLFLLDKFLRLTMKRRFRKDPDVLGLRVMMARTTRTTLPMPRRIALSTVDLGGVSAERLSTKDADESRAILYLHGGGMVAGSHATHRALTWRLADGVGVPLYAADYRLAPEHPFPAAIDDVTTAYRALVARGFSTGRVIVAGDSAGGNLTFALALEIQRLGLPRPAALVALSAVTDFFAPFESIREKADSDGVRPAHVPDPRDPLLPRR